MGRRQTFLLLLVLCVFASFVSAQSSPVEFLDEWGEATSRVLEQSRVLLRVIDPAADTSPGRDSVAVDLSSVNGDDVATANLAESGGATGVFEGEVFLTTDFSLDNTYGVDADQLYTTWIHGPDPTLDTVTATYGGASDSVEVGLSEARLVDGESRGTDTVTLGQPVRVRVRDAYADRSAGPDLTTATLTTSGSGSQVVTLTETGARTRIFEGSSQIQAAAGETVTVTHAEQATGTTSSSDTATVVGASVSFVRPRDGHATDLLLADSAVVARVSDVSRNLDPAVVESVTVSISLLLGGDSEAITLRETGPDTGVFEGSIPHQSNSYQASGDGILESGAVAAHLDTVRVQHAPNAYAEAPMTVSTTRLVDEDGTDSGSVALGSALRVEVETAAEYSSPFLDTRNVEVRSLATGDLETLRLAETEGFSYLFTGSIPVVPGAAAAGDGSLQAQPGEAVEVVHDVFGVTSSDQAAVTRSAVRFVDEAGLPVPVLLEETTARVRILDPLSAGQSPPAATIRSRISRDTEPLSLAEVPGSPGVFEGSIPMRLWGGGSGVLATGREYPAGSEPDMITASDGQAAATLLLAPGIVEVVDDQGEPRTSASAGETLRIRVTAPRADLNPNPEYLMVLVSSREYGHSQHVFLPETGGSTGIFEGTVPAIRPGDPGSAPLVYVETTDTVEVLYNASTYFTDPSGRATALVQIVPVAVQLLDGEGEAAARYVFGDDIHIRVVEPEADANPAVAETVTVTVSSHRYADAKFDVETVILNETGPDTGVFTGALPTGVLLSYSSNPVLEDGLLQFYDFVAEPDNDSKITATRNGASATARIRDSELWLTDDQGQDAESFDVGSAVQVWMRRPLGNTTPGVDTVYVSLEVRNLAGVADTVYQALAETGGDTGLFTATVPSGPRPQSNDGILQAQPSDLLFVQRSYYNLYSFDTAVFTGEGGGEPPNQAPDAVDDFASTNEDTPVIISVRANDTDPDGDPLILTTVSQAANGFAFVDVGGTISYTPAPDFYGTDTFTYTISDNRGGSGTATVSVTVIPVNDPVVAVDDAITTNEDTAVIVPVLANDIDPDGTLTITARTQGTKGLVTILGDGTIRYTPNANANGADSFSYTVSDGSASDTASVAVTITPVNDAPVAWNDSVTTPEDTAITIAILANDTDAEGDPITAGNLGAVTNGTLVLNPDGTITYTPNPDFRGFENFTYTASDPSGAQSTATVHIEITPVNDPPTAVNDAATTNEDTAKNFDVASNDTDPDGDALRVIAVTQGAKGSVVINNSPSLNGKYVIYTPNANTNGSDSFTYTISDRTGGGGATSTATVTMTVTPVNDVPDAVADSITTPEDTPVTFNPRINDTDADGDTLTITSVSGGTRGTPVLNADGTITYTPQANVSGTDFIQYNISDGHGGTDSALATITITPVNDAPDARNDLPITNEDTPITISVLSNDIDAENNTLTITALTQPTKGTAVLNANKTITYTPNLNTNGSDSFTYTISDGNGGTDTATVSLSVIPVNDPPVAVADPATVAEEGTVTIPVAANDTDPENSALTVVSVTQAAHGTVTLLSGNQVRYQPAVNYFGADTFTYTLRDAGSLTSVGTVNVTVTPVNDPPVANADSAVTNEDTPVAISVLANDTDVDGDTLTVVAVTQSANGSAGTNGTTVTFTPTANFSGTATFTYTARDAGGVDRTANVTVTVNPVNDPPLAGSDTAVTDENTPVTVSVLANDADIDGGALSVSAVTQGSNGAVSTNGVTVTYTPAAGFSGTDSFTYNVADGTGGGGGTATGLVTVTVVNVNGAPVANPDSGATREGVPVIIAVLANDTDADGDTLTVTAVGSPGVLLPDNTVRYTPGANFTGTVTFSYTVSDGQGGTANGQVTVVVGEALERVAVLATNSVAIRSGADVLSGDVIVNQASAGPFLNGAELSIAGTVTTPANWDVEADSLTVAAGSVVGGDVSYNQLTNGGTINGLQRSPLALPVFPALPAFLTATPGTTTITVATNGTRTLAPGSYLDLVVGRKGTVTFTGGTYHFRSITVDREAKLLFSAASQVRVQQKLSTKTLTTVGPATGAS
ncbi:MAG TPA: Ig-like domain-containing protein, partial [Thermoanaerobaculia bacterium]|nr:Ig-like domain-containing protein [Thermoanaerobaculia bacterium]